MSEPTTRPHPSRIRLAEPEARGWSRSCAACGPDETERGLGGLIEAGFQAIEIPLNSPEPFRSIERAAKLAPEGVLIGAGTVLSSEAVDRLDGGRRPAAREPERRSRRHSPGPAHGMVTMPGVFTPTEAFQAIAAGASALKFFPAGVLGRPASQAIMAVLPKDIPIGVVGGVSDADFAASARSACGPSASDPASTRPASNPPRSSGAARRPLPATTRPFRRRTEAEASRLPLGETKRRGVVFLSHCERKT